MSLHFGMIVQNVGGIRHRHQHTVDTSRLLRAEVAFCPPSDGRCNPSPAPCLGVPTDTHVRLRPRTSYAFSCCCWICLFMARVVLHTRSGRAMRWSGGRTGARPRDPVPAPLSPLRTAAAPSGLAPHARSECTVMCMTACNVRDTTYQGRNVSAASGTRTTCRARRGCSSGLVLCRSATLPTSKVVGLGVTAGGGGRCSVPRGP